MVMARGQPIAVLMLKVVALSACPVFLYCLTAAAAMADSCPVKIEQAVLERQGQSGYADAYTVRLSTMSDKPLDANVSFIPSNVVVTFRGLVHQVSAFSSGTAFLVMAPRGRINYMAVGSTGPSPAETTPCVGAQQVEVGYNPNLKTFNDDVPQYRDMAAPQALRIIDAAFVSRQMPVYPKDDVYACHTGTVRLTVQIGTNGALLGLGAVGQSSGYPTLDRAAVAAAAESTFSPAHLEDGTPIGMTYTIDYVFSLPADFIQRAGLKACSPS